MLNKYVALYAAHLCKRGQPFKAAASFVKYGAPSNEANFNVYRRILLDSLAAKETSYKELADVRNVLFEVAMDLKIKNGGASFEEFETYARVCHYVALRKACSNVGCVDIK